jgi:cell envelope opacity-associated protein A
VQFHQSQLLKCGRRIIPHLTPEDLLQPNDYQELEHNPHFRYEEGVLAGVQTVQMALWALKKQETR